MLPAPEDCGAVHVLLCWNFVYSLAQPYRQSLEDQQRPVRRISCRRLRGNARSLFGDRELIPRLRLRVMLSASAAAVLDIVLAVPAGWGDEDRISALCSELV